MYWNRTSARQDERKTKEIKKERKQSNPPKQRLEHSLWSCNTFPATAPKERKKKKTARL